MYHTSIEKIFLTGLRPPNYFPIIYCESFQSFKILWLKVYCSYNFYTVLFTELDRPANMIPRPLSESLQA